jgi:hypothetical protein
MSIDLVREIRATEVEVEDELDLDGDEYGDNEFAIFGYAKVEKRTEWYDDDGYPWVNFQTSQGGFDSPAGHLLKLKVTE